MSILKKLAGDSVLYGVPSILGRLLNWMLVIIHTRVFVQQESLSENAQLYTLLVPLQIFYTFGMETAFFRYGSKKENQADTFNTILSFILVFGGLITTILVLFSGQISELLNLKNASKPIIMMALILWMDAVTSIAFVKLRAQSKAKKFAVVRMTNIFINIGLNLFYLVICQLAVSGKMFVGFAGIANIIYKPANGPDYIIWANYVASAVTIIMLWKEFSKFKFKWNLAELKPILTYAYPLMIMGLAGAINLTADRLLLSRLLPEGFYAGLNTDQAFSIYAQVYKLSIFMTLVVQAYRYAADPLFFSKMGDKNSPKLIAFSTKWFTLACIMLWVGISLNLDWIQLLIGESYRSAVYIVPILLLANLFIGVYGNMSIWYKLSDKTQYGTYITIGAMTLTVVLNIILIPKLGYFGCTVTFALSSFLMVVFCYFLGQKHFAVPYEIMPLVVYLSAAAVIIWVNTQLRFDNLAYGIIYRNVLIILFTLIIFYREVKMRGGLRMD